MRNSRLLLVGWKVPLMVLLRRWLFAWCQWVWGAVADAVKHIGNEA